MSQDVEEGEEVEDVVDDEEDEEDDSVVDPNDQRRPPVRMRLVLALAGTGDAKQGFVRETISSSVGFAAAAGFFGFAVKFPAGNGREYSEKESSTK